MKASKYPSLLLLLAGLLLVKCDTTRNVESPSTNYFIKYYGNNGSQTGADFVVDNKDGSFILFGTSQIGSGFPRFFLVKADAKGNIIWERTFGTAACQARDVELASNGNIVVLGNMIATGRTDYDIYLKRFDSNGVAIDSATSGLGFTDVNTGLPANENASTVTETIDHGFIIAGSSGSIDIGHPSFIQDPLFVRFDNNLKKYPSPWPIIPTYSRGIRSASTKIVQLPTDSSFYVFGYTSFNPTLNTDSDLDFWYFNLSNNAGPVSIEGYAGSIGKDQTLFSVSSDTTRSGNGFILAGLETDVTGARLYFTKFSPPPLSFSGGDFRIPPSFLGIDLGQLSSVLNPPYPSNEFVSVSKASNGFLLLTNEATGGNSNMFLKKIDDHGNYQGAFAWGPIIFGGQGDDFAGAVQELKDGKIAIIGTMTVGQASVNNGETKMVLIKVNKDGQFAD